MKWCQRAAVLRLPSDEPLRDRRRQGRGRRHEVRRGPALPLPDGKPSSPTTPQARLFRWTFDPSGPGQHLQGGAARRPRRRVPALRRTLLHERLPATAGSSPATSSTRAPASRAWTASPTTTSRPARTRLCRPSRPTASASRSSCRAAPSAAEGDGWVLTVVWRGNESRSDLAVFEATDIAKGPVALAHLSSKVPAGFHGNWRPGPLLGVHPLKETTMITVHHLENSRSATRAVDAGGAWPRLRGQALQARADDAGAGLAARRASARQVAGDHRRRQDAAPNRARSSSTWSRPTATAGWRPSTARRSGCTTPTSCTYAEGLAECRFCS